ncbi:MAG: hypothetical protein ACKO96_43820 [Flammeovirgaceae bacterium]
MKIISLFTKAPQHQRFNYIPRYYDPAKEEMEERVNRIQKELDRERGVVSQELERGYRSRIAGSFQAARKRSKPQQQGKETLMRLGIILFLTLFLIAFITWGRPAVYGALLVVPFYAYLKFKQIKG